MNTIERSKAQFHWQYYLGLEDEFSKVARYIEICEDHKPVYSHFFAQQIISICSEFEAVGKAIYKELKFNAPCEGIGEIKFALAPISGALNNSICEVKSGSLTVRPFADWHDGGKLDWWSDFLTLKHARHTHFELATLENAIYALSALFTINLVYANTLGKAGGLQPSSLFRFHIHNIRTLDRSRPYSMVELNVIQEMWLNGMKLDDQTSGHETEE